MVFHVERAARFHPRRPRHCGERRRRLRHGTHASLGREAGRREGGAVVSSDPGPQAHRRGLEDRASARIRSLLYGWEFQGGNRSRSPVRGRLASAVAPPDARGHRLSQPGGRGCGGLLLRPGFRRKRGGSKICAGRQPSHPLPSDDQWRRIDAERSLPRIRPSLETAGRFRAASRRRRRGCLVETRGGGRRRGDDAAGDRVLGRLLRPAAGSFRGNLGGSSPR